MNTLEIIIDAITSEGYTEDEAGEILKEFVEEQKKLDDIRDMFNKLISN